MTGLDGKPAPNVRVVAYLLADAGAALVSNNAATLIGKTKRQLLDVANDVRTDAAGRFHLAVAGAVNIEAIQADDVRAIQLGVAAGGQVALTLDHAGAIAGRVTAVGVADLEGVDVFVPGTGYLAKAAKDGRYTIPNVAAGSFPLVASRQGLGRARLEGVVVAPGQATAAPDLALVADTATITGTDPMPVLPGADFQLVGQGFGATRGAPFQVTLDGTVAVAQRVDDQHLRLQAPPAGSSAPTVQVALDGVPGNAFKLPLLEALGLEPLAGHLAPGATQRFTVLAHDLADGVTAGYAAQLSLTGDAATLTNGEVRAVKPGVVRLKLSAGPFTYERPLVITAGGPYMEPIAGVGGPGKADGPAARAAFRTPHGLALDPAGNLYIADAGNNAIRRLAPDGQVTTLPVTGLKQPQALAWSAKLGQLIVVDQGNSRVCAVATDGSLKTLAEGLAVPTGLAVEPGGTIYVTEWNGNDVRRIETDGRTTVVAGAGTAGFADGPAASARFRFPAGLASDGKGHLFVADGQNHRIRKIDLATATVSTLAGSSPAGAETGEFADGPGAQAAFYWPIGLAIDAAGTLYVSDTGNGVLRTVTPAGVTGSLVSPGSAVPATFKEPGEVCVGPDGRVYVCDPTAHQVAAYFLR